MESNIVSRKNQIRSILFVMLLMIITILVLLKEYSIDELISVIKTASPIYLFTGIILMFLCFGCQAVNLSMILTSLGHPITVRRSFQYVFVGFYFGAITPCASGAQPAQFYYMSKEKIHIDLSSITIFYMIFVSQIVILLLGGIFITMQLPSFVGMETWMKYLLLFGALYMLILIVALFSLMFSKRAVPYLMYLGFSLGVKWKLIKEPDQKKDKMEAMLLSYRGKAQMILQHPGLFFRVLSVTLVQWLFYYLITYMVYRSFGNHSHSGLELMSSQSIVSISVTAVPLPGAVGIAEKAFLTKFQPYYLEHQLGLAMLLNRIINFYLPLFISFMVYLYVHFRIIRKQK